MRGWKIVRNFFFCILCETSIKNHKSIKFRRKERKYFCIFRLQTPVDDESFHPLCKIMQLDHFEAARFFSGSRWRFSAINGVHQQQPAVDGGDDGGLKCFVLLMDFITLKILNATGDDSWAASCGRFIAKIEIDMEKFAKNAESQPALFVNNMKCTCKFAKNKVKERKAEIHSLIKFKKSKFTPSSSAIQLSSVFTNKQNTRKNTRHSIPKISISIQESVENVEQIFYLPFISESDGIIKHKKKFTSSANFFWKKKNPKFPCSHRLLLSRWKTRMNSTTSS